MFEHSIVALKNVFDYQRGKLQSEVFAVLWTESESGHELFLSTFVDAVVSVNIFFYIFNFSKTTGSISTKLALTRHILEKMGLKFLEIKDRSRFS